MWMYVLAFCLGVECILTAVILISIFIWLIYERRYIVTLFILVPLVVISLFTLFLLSVL